MDMCKLCVINVIMFGWISFLDCVSCIFTDDYPRKSLVPRFHPTPINVTYEIGTLATLPCGVDNLGTKTIIWRKQPYNVPITVGLEQFLEINRFYLSHVPHQHTWDLLIKNVQTFDAGTYECQIASTEKLLRRNITLHVTETRSADIPDVTLTLTGTRFVEKGNTIVLVCNASGIDAHPRDIDWSKDGGKLTAVKRHHMTIDMKISYSTKTLVSTVKIYNAHTSDTGIYVCRTTELQTESFKVDVLNTETNNVKREYEELLESRSHQNSHYSEGMIHLHSVCVIVLSVLFSCFLLRTR